MNLLQKFQQRFFQHTLIVVATIGLVLEFGNHQTASGQPPAVRKSIQDGIGFLRKTLAKQQEYGFTAGEASIAAYAMIKGGTSPGDPLIQAVIASVKKRVSDKGVYSQGIYIAGCDLMLLEAASKDKTLYARELQAITNRIESTQSATGYWNYLGGDKEGGDTSVIQYAILGLWSAKRAGIKVNPQKLEKAAQWLMSTQFSDGIFLYRPGRSHAASENVKSLSMAMAGVCSLLVVKRLLYPNQASLFKAKKTPPKKTGPVEDVDLDASETEKKQGKVKVTYVPQISHAKLVGSIRRGLAWSNGSARANGVVSGKWFMYTAYGVERVAALAEIDKLGGINWYASGANRILRLQLKDGSWKGNAEKVPSTSFAILFLSRATAKILGQSIPEFGSGTLRGNRGLPDNLGDLEQGKDGSVKKKKVAPSNTEDLLQALLSNKSLDIKDAPEKIVEKIQLGSEKERKQWLKPERRKQLLRMAEHPRADVRRVAIWALGRTGGMKTLKVVMNALENDPDLDVIIAARDALCYISRKPNGFKFAIDPTIGVSKTKKKEAIEAWHKGIVKEWKKWYFTVRPYQERDDLSENPKTTGT
jgi:hypothetical protein